MVSPEPPSVEVTVFVRVVNPDTPLLVVLEVPPESGAVTALSGLDGPAKVATSVFTGLGTPAGVVTATFNVWVGESAPRVKAAPPEGEPTSWLPATETLRSGFSGAVAALSCPVALESPGTALSVPPAFCTATPS